MRFALALVGVMALGGACGPQQVDSGPELQAELKKVHQFPTGSYYQVDSFAPRAGQLSLLMLNSDGNGGFWAYRCTSDGCGTSEWLQGTYVNTRTRLYLHDASGDEIGKYAWSLDGEGSLSLRAIGTRITYPLDPVSEDLCDSSGGAWSDDEIGPFNCTCAQGDWGPGGCPALACADGQVQCGSTCSDLTSDNSNCGSCGTACAKGQTCVQGACQ